MTNTELQMIGIDEATFNAASEEQRVEWGKANTTAGMGLCESALEWLKSKKDYIWFFSSFNTFEQMHGDLHVLKDRFIYRLAPDYQPPVNPVAGWVEYPIEAVGGIYCVIGLNGGKYRLDKAANRVGFGGVQFKSLHDASGFTDWTMETRLFVQIDGYFSNHDSGYSSPAVPVRARFWKEPK